MRLAVWGCLAIGAGLAGCIRQPPEPGTANAIPPPSAEQPNCGSASASEKKGVKKGTEWRRTYGSPGAKVLVEAFYPMSPQHRWVDEINQRLVKRFPDRVRVVYVNWWAPEGKEAFIQRNVGECSTYLVNGQIVAQKSPAKGGWTEEDLVAAVQKAVQEVYGKDAENQKDR